MKLKKTPLFFYFFLFIFLGYSQNYREVDSLINIVSNSKLDSNKVKEEIKVSRQLILIGQVDSAVYWANKAIIDSKKCKFETGECMGLIKLGQINSYKANYPIALDFYLQGLRIATKIKNIKLESDITGNIGIIYDYQKDFEKAIQFYRKCLNLKVKLKDKVSIYSLYGNMAIIMREKGMHDSALYYHFKTLRAREGMDNPRELGIVQGNIGSVYLDMKKFKQADSILKIAVSNMRLSKDERGLSLAMTSYAISLMQLKKINEAIKLAEESYAIATKLHLNEQIEASSGLLAELYSKNHQFEKAYLFSVRNRHIKDTIYNIEKNKEIVSKQLTYEFERKQLGDSLKREEQKALEQIKVIAEKKENEAKLFRQRIIAISGIVAFVLAMIIVYILFKNNRQKQRTNVELSQKNILIEQQKQEVTNQKHIVEEKNKEIMDSINYAKRIQYALLAHDTFLNKYLPEHFILFKPKDIVSGDFYWATKKDNKFYLAVCDSTGHGVPGAFMSLLNIGFLSEAINEKGIEKPSMVLDYVRQRLIDNISKEGQKDGFDGILLCYEMDTKKVSYAAANNAPVIIANNELIELKTDKMPVGISDKLQPFSEFNIELKSGSTLYLYTDGYADQFGGPKGKKFKYRQLEEKIFEVSNESPENQKQLLENIFNAWKGDLEQIDDVLLVGIRF